jgi:xylulokinase
MRDVIEGQRAAGVDMKAYRITGGATRSTLWNQMQADVYGRPVETLAVSEVTALGAAIFAAVGAGLFKDVYEAVKHMVHPTGTFEPTAANTKVYDELYPIFAQTYQALKVKVYPGLTEFQSKAG